MTAASATPSPAPPYSAGIRAPSQPASVSARTNLSGYSLFRSSSRQYSSPKPAQRSRIALRIWSCWSVVEKSTLVARRRGSRSLGRGCARGNHEAAGHHEHDRAVLFDATLPDLYDPPPRPRARFAHVDDLAVGVERVALEQRGRERDLVPAERESVLARVRDHESRDHADAQDAVHERTPELRLSGVVLVDVDGVCVVRQQREPDVVGLRDRASARRAMHVAHLEVLEEA